MVVGEMTQILAVDDSPSMRALVRSTLEEAGFDVVSACDGVEALATARGKPFGLVLADVNMPNMNGIELTREIRALPGYAFTPILILTTESGTDRKGEAKAAGATGWLVKPFEPAKLVATVRKVLG
jgi:two-component system chemotaxis response regulator CheY